MPHNGGTICSVVTCKSHAKQKNKTGEYISFHRFPRDPHLRIEWIRKCFRQEGFNPENKRICSKHFLEEDYEDICRARIMNVPPKKLKSTAIPSVNLESTSYSYSSMNIAPSNITNNSLQKITQKEQLQIVSELLGKKSIREVRIVRLPEIPETSTDELSEFKFEFENKTESVELCQNEKYVCLYIQSHCDSLKAENEALKRDLVRMKKENNILLHKNRQLQMSVSHLQNGRIQRRLAAVSLIKKSRQNKILNVDC